MTWLRELGIVVCMLFLIVVGTAVSAGVGARVFCSLAELCR